MSHTCPLPNPEDHHESDDWCCPDCTQWWTLDSDYCHQCGRAGPPRWVQSTAPSYGPDREDGTHYLKWPTWEPITFPEVTVRRGGIRYPTGRTS